MTLPVAHVPIIPGLVYDLRGCYLARCTNILALFLKKAFTGHSLLHVRLMVEGE